MATIICNHCGADGTTTKELSQQCTCPRDDGRRAERLADTLHIRETQWGWPMTTTERCDYCGAHPNVLAMSDALREIIGMCEDKSLRPGHDSTDGLLKRRIDMMDAIWALARTALGMPVPGVSANPPPEAPSRQRQFLETTPASSAPRRFFGYSGRPMDDDEHGIDRAAFASFSPPEAIPSRPFAPFVTTPASPEETVGFSVKMPDKPAPWGPLKVQFQAGEGAVAASLRGAMRPLRPAPRAALSARRVAAAGRRRALSVLRLRARMDAWRPSADVAMLGMRQLASVAPPRGACPPSARPGTDQPHRQGRGSDHDGDRRGRGHHR